MVKQIAIDVNPVGSLAHHANMSTLIDRFGRTVNYVRLSVTDRCDLRCVYCMAERMQFLPKREILSLEEIHEIAAAMSELGVGKIRLTGGEPLVRQGVVSLAAAIAALPGIRELVLTTNGTRLAQLAEPLRLAGVKRLNISLDSLQPARFRQISRVGELSEVLAGVNAARAAGFERIKLNTVILKHRNHDEVIDLVNFARAQSVDICFIEEMPLGRVDGRDRVEQFYGSDAIHADIERHYRLTALSESSGGPARYFSMNDSPIRIGFISAHSHNFCASCNRVRVTVQGRLLLCLGQEHSADLRAVLRAQPGDRAALKEAIRMAMAHKPWGHEFKLEQQPRILRHMSVTGG
jgi:cyclic pyranopterin phosphate synthase